MIRFIIIIILIILVIFLFSDTSENFDSTTQPTITQQNKDEAKEMCLNILKKKEEIKKMDNFSEYITNFITNNITADEEKIILSNCNSKIIDSTSCEFCQKNGCDIPSDIQKILSMNSCKIQKIIDILIKKETNIEAQATARILIEILSARYNIYSPVVDNCQIANLNETSGCISAYIKGMDGCYSSINDANMTKQIGNIKSCIKTKSELTESVKDFVHDSKFIGGRAYAIMRDGETSSGGIKSVFEGMLSSSSSMDPTNYRK